MTGPRAYSVYIGQMRDAIQHALQFTAGLTQDQFVADDRTNYATLRILEIVDEAAKRVPDQIRDLDSTIPWQKMATMPGVMIDRYDEVNLAEVWNIVQVDLGEMVPRLERLQRQLERQEDEEWERG